MTATTYGPVAATRADAALASMRTAAVNADPAATATDREHAADAEMGAYESYRHTRGVPAYAGQGHAEVRSAEAECGDFEAGE